MRATVWNDYVCPWAYLGRHRTRLMEDLGVEVDRRPFELHPELPPEGRAVRPGGRLAATFDRVAAECEASGMPFVAPRHSPNTRLALETISVVRHRRPDLADVADDAISDARWLRDEDIADPMVLITLLDGVGLDGEDVVRSVRDGEGTSAVEVSMREAREYGIAATPAWRFDTGFVIPGVQPEDTVSRWVRRIIDRGP